MALGYKLGDKGIAKSQAAREESERDTKKTWLGQGLKDISTRLAEIRNLGDDSSAMLSRTGIPGRTKLAGEFQAQWRKLEGALDNPETDAIRKTVERISKEVAADINKGASVEAAVMNRIQPLVLQLTEMGGYNLNAMPTRDQKALLTEIKYMAKELHEATKNRGKLVEPSPEDRQSAERNAQKMLEGIMSTPGGLNILGTYAAQLSLGAELARLGSDLREMEKEGVSRADIAKYAEKYDVGRTRRVDTSEPTAEEKAIRLDAYLAENPKIKDGVIKKLVAIEEARQDREMAEEQRKAAQKPSQEPENGQEERPKQKAQEQTKDYLEILAAAKMKGVAMDDPDFVYLMKLVTHVWREQREAQGAPALRYVSEDGINQIQTMDDLKKYGRLIEVDLFRLDDVGVLRDNGFKERHLRKLRMSDEEARQWKETLVDSNAVWAEIAMLRKQMMDKERERFKEEHPPGPDSPIGFVGL